MKTVVVVVVVIVIVLLLALICWKCAKRFRFRGGYNHFIVIDRESQKILNALSSKLDDLAHRKCHPFDRFEEVFSPVKSKNYFNEWDARANYIIRYIDTYVESLRDFVVTEQVRTNIEKAAADNRYYDLFASIVGAGDRMTIKAYKHYDFVTFVYFDSIAKVGRNCYYYHRIPNKELSFEERFEAANQKDEKRACGVAITIKNVVKLIKAANDIHKEALQVVRDAPDTLEEPELTDSSSLYDYTSESAWLTGGYSDILLRHAADLEELRNELKVSDVWGRRVDFKGFDKYFNSKVEQCLYYTVQELKEAMIKALKEATSSSSFLKMVAKGFDKVAEKRDLVDELEGLKSDILRETKASSWFAGYTKIWDRYHGAIDVLPDRMDCDDDPFETVNGIAHFNPGWIRHGTPGHPLESKVKVTNIKPDELDMFKKLFQYDAIYPESIMLQYNDEPASVPIRKQLNGKDYLISTPKSIYTYRGIGLVESDLLQKDEIDPKSKHNYNFKLVTFGYDFLANNNRLGVASGFGLYMTLNPEVALMYSQYLLYIFEIQYQKYHYLFIDRILDEATSKYLTHDYSPEGIVFPTDEAIKTWICCEYAKNDNITLSFELREYMKQHWNIQPDPIVEDHVNMVIDTIGYGDWTLAEVDKQRPYKNEFFEKLKSEASIMGLIEGFRNELVSACPSLDAIIDSGESIHAYDNYPPIGEDRPYEYLITAAMQKMNVDIIVSYQHGNGRMKWMYLSDELIQHYYPYEIVAVNGRGIRPRYALANDHEID